MSCARGRIAWVKSASWSVACSQTERSAFAYERFAPVRSPLAKLVRVSTARLKFDLARRDLDEQAPYERRVGEVRAGELRALAERPGQRDPATVGAREVGVGKEYEVPLRAPEDGAR